MNILYVAFEYPPVPYGISCVAHEIAKNLSLQNEKLIIIAPSVKGARAFDNASGVTTYRITTVKIVREIALFFMMRYLAAKYKIDVMYNLTWYPSAAVSYFISAITGIPYAVNVYAMDYFEDRSTLFNKLKYNFLRAYIKRLAFERAKSVLTISNFMKDRLTVRGIDAVKIKTISLGVNGERFKPGLNAREIIAKHRLENKKILLTVSRLDDYKGHDMVIKALPEIIRAVPNIVYVIVGAGPNENTLKMLVKSLALDDCVQFLGTVENALLPLYYNACDAFIMASREMYEQAKVEGYGLVFLEAGACAKPVIAGRSGGIADAVLDGVTGILVDPLNVEQIRNAAIKLLTDNNYARQLGAQGLKRIREERLEWPSAAEKIREILSAITTVRQR